MAGLTCHALEQAMKKKEDAVVFCENVLEWLDELNLGPRFRCLVIQAALVTRPNTADSLFTHISSGVK